VPENGHPHPRSYEMMGHDPNEQLERIWGWLADHDALGDEQSGDVAKVTIGLLGVLTQYLTGQRRSFVPFPHQAGGQV
jgi:hypothetical protein